MDRSAAEIRELLELARKLDPEASLTVFSDHGMTPVRWRYDLVKEVSELGFEIPGDYLAAYDSTMARFWFFNDQARSAITQLLNTLSAGRVVPEDELRRLGVFFPDHRYGELVFLLHPGWLLSRSDFNGRGWMPNGMHGYHPDDPYSDAVFLSNRRPQSEPRTIADVFQCLREGLLDQT